jgi:Tol biopolymer transport system component
MNNKKVFIGIVFVIAILMALGFQNSSEHKVLFEKAKFTMETKGDLRGAINLFNEIIKKYPNQREYAAKSQLYIGLCYEKLGLKQAKQAQRAFQKVVDNYPRQVEAVRLAKEKLDIILKAQKVIEKGNEEFKLKKIYLGRIYPASISPDGKKLALLDSKDWDIYLQDIATEEKVRLTNEHNSIRSLKWSPDSKMIVFGDLLHNLYVVSTQDGPSKMIIKADPESVKAKDAVSISGWTSDSKKIIFQVPSKGLFAIPACGGEWEEIFTFRDPKKAKQYEEMTLSPDGRIIAYVSTQSGNKDIYVTSVKGGEFIRITNNPATDFYPRWSYDSHWLAFGSNRTEKPEAWVIKVTQDGKPDSMPFQVTRGGILDGNWMQDSKVGYSCAVRTEHIYIVNPDGTEEFQLTKFPAFNKEPRWSPDGKMIFFASDYNQPLNKFRKWKVPSKGGEAKLLGDEEWDFVLSPEGKKIAYKTQNNSIILKVPAEGGEPKELLTISEKIDSLDWSPDRKRIVFSYSINPTEYSNVREYLRESRSGVSIISADGGKPKKLIPAEIKGVGYTNPRWSPDGKKIAFRIYNQNASEEGRKKEIGIWIGTIDVEGGEPRLIAKLKRDGYKLCWTPDGKYIVYEERIKGMDFELCKVPAEGGEPEKMNVKGRSAVFSPDGKKIAFSRRLGAYYEFWLVENFLPEEKTKKKSKLQQ